MATKTKISKVRKNLSKVSTDDLNKVNNFIESLLSKQKSKDSNIKSLEGIWADLGFENIINLEDNIKEIRKELSSSYNINIS
jgi:hypothetical protein